MRMVSLCIILAVLVSLAAGCKGADTNAEDVKKYDVKLYYVNDEYVATGNEALSQMQEPYEVSLQAKPEEVYAEALSKLKESPLDGYDTMLSQDVVIRSVKTKDGMAVVDFSSENLSGGSMEEGLLVSQVVLTLLDSFDTIQEVKFTLDGEDTDSLMGHVDVTKPFKLGNTGSGSKTVTIAE